MSSESDFLILKSQIIDTYSHYAEGLDSKNWPLVRSCFADEVLIDYGEISSPSGNPDVPRKADEWLKHLQSVINGFHITRHTITNHRLVQEGERVSCKAYLIADHIIFPDPEINYVEPQNVVTVVGEYTNDYRHIDGAWKIIRSELLVNWTSGNLELFDKAAENVANMQKV